MRLSVFIPSTPGRLQTTLPHIVSDLSEQMGSNPECELIVLLDNERISIGEKMNLMSVVARGDYVSVVADDDSVVSDYVSTLLDAIDAANGADVIVFDTEYYVAGTFTATIREGKDLPCRKERSDLWLRPPSDKMCWRREFRAAHPQDHCWEEHDKWNGKVQKHIRSEYRIDRALYKFFYEPDKKDGSGYRTRLDQQRRTWRA